MGLSSNILWHQTNYNSLRKIIKSKKILCAYSVEDVADMAGQNLAFPMVSMCDLPLSEFTEFQGKYDHYSIGLSREWGIKNRFTPIWYYEAKSRVPQILRREITNAAKSGSESITSLIGILSYMKKVEGPLPKHNYATYRFYDEREVRFVPSFDYVLSGGDKPILTEDEYAGYKTANGSPVINAYVGFEWSDVRFIIVKEKHQISKIIFDLESLGCDNKQIGVFCEDEIYQDVIGYKHNVALPAPAAPLIADDLKNRIVQLLIDKIAGLI